MKLSIIIVSWNTRGLTLKCIKSIFAYLKNINLEIYLVDNNSSDGTVEAAEKFKNDFVTQAFRPDLSELKLGVTNKLHIIVNKENVGFARANNQALSYLFCHPCPASQCGVNSSGNPIEQRDPHFREDDKEEKEESEYFLLLNPDTEFIDDKINLAIEFMAAHRDIGILGPKLLNSDKILQKSCRKFPALLNQLFIQFKFYNFFPDKIKATREYFMLDFEHNEIREVDQVMGAAMLIRSEVFKTTGLLDENFWAIFEEVDLCKRAKDAGYKIYFYPDWQIIHHKEQSFKQWPGLRKQINFNRSLYYYFKKHKPFWQLFILWLVQPVNLVLTWVDMIFGIRKGKGKSKDL